MLANSKIVPIAGQSTVTLDGSKITFACPGTFSLKGGAHDFVGPAGQAALLNPLPVGTVTLPTTTSASSPTSEELADTPNNSDD